LKSLIKFQNESNSLNQKNSFSVLSKNLIPQIKEIEISKIQKSVHEIQKILQLMKSTRLIK